MINIGYLYLLFAAFLYGIFGIFTKLLINSYDIYQQIFLRSFITLIILIFFIKRINFTKIDLKKHLLFLLSYFICTITYSYAIKESDVNTSIFTYFCGNIISAIAFGYFFLNEKISKKKSLAIICVLAGILLFYNDYEIYFKNKLGVSLGLACGIFASILTYYRKILSIEISSLYLTFSQATIAIIATSPSIFFNFNYDYSLSYIVIVYGIINFSVQYFALKGFEKVNLNTGTIILTSEIVFAIFFARLFLNEQLNLLQYFGSAMIFIAIFILSLDKD